MMTLALVCSSTILTACGSGTTTVTSTNSLQTPSTSAVPSAQTTQSSAPTVTSVAAGQTATAGGEATGGGTAAPRGPRTAAAPAYVHEETPTGELGGAVAELKAAGYTPIDDAQYHSNQTLRVLVGTHMISATASNERAFFFIGSRYIGTDAREPSAKVNVVSQGETEVTLAYTLYRGASPSGTANVTFQLDNGFLVPAQAIPPASERL